ncbi:NAD-dependent epimerase/dehydratase family protein [Brevundimonas intermedia]|uniref:NAD-dependent epimerase/dehydratase family protein n=1 Tax=Brevundimonas intermedia TaxID=74315 RepID=UPI00320AD5C6
MTKVLVTGGSGFFGHGIMKAFAANGFDVVGTTTKSNGEHLIECDIVDSDAVKRAVDDNDPDIIIHSAALSSVTSGKPIDYYTVNVVGTENVLRAASSRKRRVVLVSTAGVYGNQTTDVLTEDLPPAPIHHYGISKFACERLAVMHGAALDITIVRPFNIIGVGQKENFIVPKLMRAFSNRDSTVRLGNTNVYRDYIDLQTASEIMVRIADQPRTSGQVLNLCAGHATSLDDLLSIMAIIYEYDIKVIVDPEFVRPSEVWRLIGSNRRLIENDCWITPPDLSQVLRKMVAEQANKGASS